MDLESAEVAAECHHSAVLDALNNVLTGKVARSDSTDVPVIIMEGDATNNNVTNETDKNFRMSPLSQDTVMDDGGSSKRRSPAVTMACLLKRLPRKKPKMLHFSAKI